MRVTKSVVFGLVSLVYNANATKATGKPVLAKRQSTITVTSNGCTAICWTPDNGGNTCQAYCSGYVPFHPATSTAIPPTVTTTVTSSTQDSMEDDGSGDDDSDDNVSDDNVSDDDCIENCSVMDESDIDCVFSCFLSFDTSTSSTTATADAKAALNRRTVVSATNGDCTAICWDLMPGTECDVRCSSEFKTELPGSVAPPPAVPMVSIVFHRSSKHKHFLPSKAALVANLEARENVQVQQVREARLARKFGGNLARDDSKENVISTVFSTPPIITSTVTGLPSILPTEIPQKAEASNITAAPSKASVSGSAAAALSSLGELLLSDVFSSLSASSVATPLPMLANATVAAPASTGSAPTVAATRSSIVSTATVSANTTAISASSKTITASTTTTEALIVSHVGTPASTYASYTLTTFTAGAAPEYIGSTGLVFSLLVGLAANLAFLM